MLTSLACTKRRLEYEESKGLKAREAAAKAAAVSPAMSDPGCSASSLYAVRDVDMSSARCQQ